jgi:[acyl-carrier-protein] S-malonyltransferase
VANFNAPSQTVVSGDPAGVARLVDLAVRAGAEETLVLHVGVAAHSPFMEPIKRGLSSLIGTLPWREPDLPMVANVSGAVLTTGAAIRHTLIEGITRPVEWVRCVRALHASGCTTFLELGPGRVLTGLVSQIVTEVMVYASASPRRISVFAESVNRPVDERIAR